MSDLLNAKDLCERFGISYTTWARWKRRGLVKRFEVKQPMGQRRYSPALVARYTAGESLTRMGRGSRVMEAGSR